MAPQSATRDIIAIGGSLGGVEALRELAKGLPTGLPAAIFVVLHVGRQRSRLAELLNGAGPLPAKVAEGGEHIERGRIYVAQPDRHLLLHDGHILVSRGPHENMWRPAIDPLFRSAACSYGARVVGVVLSGLLDDGAAGLDAIKRCGGTAVIQDPADAAAPDMPRTAQRLVSVDHVAPIAAMAPLLARLAASPAGRQPAIPEHICVEAAIAAQERGSMRTQDQLGQLSPFSCPECGGTLWEVAEGRLLRYRCHVGHAYTAESMLAAQSDATDALLNRLLRSYRERAELTRRLAVKELARQQSDLARELDSRAQGYDEDAALMERLLAERGDNSA
ncbi:MAG TPA: chemotaxis protein CheB [Stellaceae bacterium]|nr:chemotaxis protein CheB [Stellaceae bacterium]